MYFPIFLNIFTVCTTEKLNRIPISLLVLFISILQAFVSYAAQVNEALQLIPHYLLVSQKL